MYGAHIFVSQGTHLAQNLTSCFLQTTNWSPGKRLSSHHAPLGPNPLAATAKTGRWKVDTDRLQDSLMHLAPPRCDWKRLCLLANTCQYRRPSLKFKDSTELKRLCHLRNSTEDANQRASMSRHIIASRRAERAQWLQSLHAAASSGDPSAIAFLKAKQKAPSDWSQLVAHAGSQPEAIQNVRNHFQQTFATTPLDTRAADCAPHIATLETTHGQHCAATHHY